MIQQQGKQFQVRKTQVLKGSPIFNSQSKEQRKQTLQPILIFQQEQAQKVENKYVPLLLNQERRNPIFQNLKGNTQFLGQLQGNKDTIFGMKNSDSQSQLQQTNQQLLHLNHSLQVKCRKLEANAQQLMKVMDDLETLINELKSEKEEQEDHILQLNEKTLRQKLKKKLLKEKVQTLQEEIEYLNEKYKVDNLDDENEEDREQESEIKSEGSQRKMVLTHSQIYQMLEYLQSRGQQQQWLDGNLQNFQQQDIDTDNMTYEQLLALEEEIGNVPRGLTKRQIKQIPKYQVQHANDMPERCTVCLNEFQLNEKYRELGCKHLYHSKCIKEWLEKEKNCPNCKVEVVVPDTHHTPDLNEDSQQELNEQEEKDLQFH